MSSAAAVDDLTARARVRDAAVRRFARDGFGASLRAIAADAGVSAALIVHHFGSKDGLRAVCDDHVLAVIRESKEGAVSSSGPGGMLASLAAIEEYAPAAAYVAQTLASGDGAAAAFLDHMVQDAVAYLDQGVAAGVVRPSRDPVRRARYLVMANTGTLLLHLRLHGGDVVTSLRELSDDVTLPALELYCEGLLTDSSLLEAYLPQAPDPVPTTGGPS